MAFPFIVQVCERRGVFCGIKWGVTVDWNGNEIGSRMNTERGFEQMIEVFRDIEIETRICELENDGQFYPFRRSIFKKSFVFLLLGSLFKLFQNIIPSIHRRALGSITPVLIKHSC